MDELITPMERRVVEYHVWKTQYFKPVAPKILFRLLYDYSGNFKRFKGGMNGVQRQEFNLRIVKAWQDMNLLDLAKALGEYEADCPNFSGLNIGTETVSGSNHPH